MRFSRQEDWSELCRPPGDLPDPGMERRSLHCRQIIYHLSYREVPGDSKGVNIAGGRSTRLGRLEGLVVVGVYSLSHV